MRSIEVISILQHQIFSLVQKTRSNIASTFCTVYSFDDKDLSMKGKFNLDEDIRKYFSNFIKKLIEIKIRHLVNHTSGIHEYVNLLIMLQSLVETTRFGQ